MAEYIERKAAMTVPVLPKEYRTYPTANLDDAYEAGWNDALENLRNIPAAENLLPVVRWISVTEQLPYRIPCNAGTAYSEAVIVLTSGRKVMVGVWDGTDWIVPFDFWEAWGEEITHWMPLPKLPKEDMSDG